MFFDIFQQGPAVYIPILIISLLITLISYCSFPLLFAMIRKSPISSKNYSTFCYVFNGVIAFVFVIINGGAINVAPYLLWTSVFSSIGKNILNKKGAITEQFH